MALKLKVELGADGTGFATVMDKAERRIGNFAAGPLDNLKGAIAGAFSVGAIAAFAKSTISYASHLRDLADELGVSVEWLQEMQFLLVQNGGKADELVKVMAKLNEAHVAAVTNPKGPEAGAFAKFGINPQQANLTEDIAKIAEAFRTGITREFEPAFRALGGKAALKLIPAFVEGIDKGRAEARRAGGVMSEDVIDQLDALDDRFARLGIQLKTKLGPIIAAIGEDIVRFIRSTMSDAKALKAFVDAIDFESLTTQDPRNIKQNLQQAFEIAVQTRTLERKKNQAEDAAAAKEAEERKAARRRRENETVLPSPLSNAHETGKFQFANAAAGSNGLVSVGNFLGQSNRASGLVAVAEKTNALITQSNNYLSRIAPATEKLAATGGVPL